MDDLIAFYRDRLDEDERSALDWQRHKQARTEQFMNDPRRQHVSPFRKPVTDAQLSEHAYHDRFDPARVLREVEAKRRILDEHPILTAGRVCTRCSDYAEPGEVFREVPGPCATVRLLALPYADHDDFREEWKP